MSDSNTSIAPGLDAIFNATTSALDSEIQKDHVLEVPITSLIASPYQPRTNFDETYLRELSESIIENGIIQPIITRKIDDTYEIIAGERRWRAAKLAELSSVPVIVKEANDDTVLAYALIENIQRKDLNIIEEARAYHRLLKELNFFHEDIAKRVGKSRSHITNILRLLNLPDSIQRSLEKEQITMGHAKAILSLSEELQNSVVEKVIEKSLSVRETEKIVQSVLDPKTTAPLPEVLSEQLQEWKQKLTSNLTTKAEVSLTSKGKGKLIVHFNSIEEADDIVERLALLSNYEK